MTEEATFALKKLAVEFEQKAATAKAAIETAAKEKQEIARFKAELATLKREHQEELAAERAAFEADKAAIWQRSKSFATECEKQLNDRRFPIWGLVNPLDEQQAL